MIREVNHAALWKPNTEIKGYITTSDINLSFSQLFMQLCWRAIYSIKSHKPVETNDMFWFQKYPSVLNFGHQTQNMGTFVIHTVGPRNKDLSLQCTSRDTAIWFLSQSKSSTQTSFRDIMTHWFELFMLVSSWYFEANVCLLNNCCKLTEWNIDLCDIHHDLYYTCIQVIVLSNMIGQKRKFEKMEKPN